MSNMYGTGSMKTASNSAQNYPYVLMSDLRSPEGLKSLHPSDEKNREEQEKENKRMGKKTFLPFFTFISSTD